MRLLRVAVASGRWDLAAHTILLAAARRLRNGEKPYAGRSKEKARRVKA